MKNTSKLQIATMTQKEEGKVPKWQRSAIIDENLNVYVPAAASGNEVLAVMCALQDGVSSISSLGHAFLPADWMKNNYPDIACYCDKVSAKLRYEFHSFDFNSL
ncbi:MAG: hypothetical protein KJ900_13585 [Proteobacteria bacterium]|jgi:hypothetical protein|nr:hypothetical protein [Desulfocapsa sp.]MBU3945469.1 hypothetical protein [Pseudomonadota bacterium]MCG2744507.1 hypothetical protein [Desulfobacteraceae bacterium]MBU3982095.1 hypothetical protein [Pseudomonadota bacterium]MBU4029180.1 hypothetical protein [Pseudomonadota bacterium]